MGVPSFLLGGSRVVALVAMSAGVLAVAGCGTGAWPSNAGTSTSLPPTATTPNIAATAGACGLLTPAEVIAATGAEVGRVSYLGDGCVWERTQDGSDPVLNLQTTTTQDGDIATTFARRRAELADPTQNPGIGQASFVVSGIPGAVDWVQDGKMFDLRIMDSGPGVDRNAAALTLAQQASARVGQS
ncbi:hypothetical protein G4X40_18780 [Rhodococcus sp. D2-41]|uniref:hypothetical protein n=1 Tax=Speluncibacter jeojiensis TaxID=2710754 RepID=UPI00241073BA|nr:hypothetical protein [Rhodococcus sp. D2-41]MDG3012189.1 hypothetical protein [Rhodococcus sp. D2-41]